ncbi:type I restriction-modification system, M subunit [Mycoplasma haemocanis str. Illinois]|uniref:site-specific DNA-methyltransferase (adenine-specific) n=1 Tax=Mycoplasma haemocanis (strain Illinois) TaxID=1111676 RepID=H6N6Z5_MYCHN|nr:type I restriction-modification system subunit M [Mycoplasma haemocanis]AEW45417.1 type I restriction-modification system, M subunit [Mycoplasma haemocanis str. Illinois]
MSNVREERLELYRSIWNSCKDLQGSMDGYEMKNYIFVMMFYRFMSESFVYWFNKPEWDAGNKEFDYANWSDEEALNWKEDTVKKKGYFILPSQLFGNVFKKATEDKGFAEEINTFLSDIFRSIESSAIGFSSEDDIKGLFTSISWNDTKLGTEVLERNKKIVEVMGEIESSKFDFISTHEIDVLGDAYEYLMGEYAATSGKKGGEFYTPPEVSRLLTKIAVGDKTYISGGVYDPACGSGSLLLKCVAFLGAKNVSEICGQEKNMTTYNLCRMNMFLHGVNYNKFDIKHGDTLEYPDPYHFKKRFEIILSNPPYSAKWAGEDDVKLLTDPRFEQVGALAPKNAADFAFILHCLYLLSSTGKAVIVCATGVLTRLGKEKSIRKWLVNQNYIESVIYLAGNLFYGTGINTVIIVLNKAKTDSSVLFVDATNIFTKDRGKNRLSDADIERILKIYRDRVDVPFVAKVASNNEIEEKEYDMGMKAYIDSPVKTEEVDIVTLNSDIEDTVKKINGLRYSVNEIIKEIEC